MDLSKVQSLEANDRTTRWCLALGIGIWFIDLMMTYGLPSVSCEWGWFPFTIAGIPGLKLVEAAIALPALLLMLVLIYLPWRNWQRFQNKRLRNHPNMLQDTEKDRRSLLAFVTMLVNSFFFLFIIALFVPLSTLGPCVRG